MSCPFFVSDLCIVEGGNNRKASRNAEDEKPHNPTQTIHKTKTPNTA
jgi:hypothetical protein